MNDLIEHPLRVTGLDRFTAELGDALEDHARAVPASRPAARVPRARRGMIAATVASAARRAGGGHRQRAHRLAGTCLRCLGDAAVRRRVDELATLRFVEQRANALLIGPSGAGKTQIAIASARKAAEARYRVLYTTAADLVAQDQQGGAGGPLADHDALLERPAASGHR
jgi:IstB-like ATP binding protein